MTEAQLPPPSRVSRRSSECLSGRKGPRTITRIWIPQATFVLSFLLWKLAEFYKVLSLLGLFSPMLSHEAEVCDLSLWARSEPQGMLAVLLTLQNTGALMCLLLHLQCTIRRAQVFCWENRIGTWQEEECSGPCSGDWLGGREGTGLESRESGEPAGSVLFCFGFQSERWILVSVGQVKKENTRPLGHKWSKRDGSF